jgi:DNA-binding GntR family transcriptional regulator
MSSLLPVERTGVVDQVTDRLRVAIMSGNLEPGIRVVEADLARRLGTSRAPVREAMQMLEREGLLVTLPRGGMFVPTFTPRDAWEIYTLRAALETEAVRLLVRHLEPTQMQRLKRLVADMRSARSRSDTTLLTSYDAQFHQALVTMCGNARLARSWGSMMSQIQLLVRQANLPSLDSADYVARRHELIIDAMETGDEAAVVATVNEHIRSVGEEMRQALHRAEFEETSKSDRQAVVT